MSVDLFKLKGKVELDTQEYNEDVDAAIKKGKELGDALGGSNGGLESWITKLSSGLHVVETIGGAAVNTIKGMADAGLSMVEVAANFRALDESMSAAFGNMGDEANAAFERVGKTNNILIRRLQQSGLSFFRQFKSAGMDNAEALSEMETMLGYAADAAAAYDISLEDASERMRSFIRGNVEAGEAIGLFVTQSDRQRLGLELFGNGKWQELEEHERQAVLLARIMEIYGQSNVFGQGAREAQNWTNVVGNLTSAWEEAQAIMGEGMMDALIPALQELTNWIKENPALFKSLGETFGSVATAMVNAFKELLTFIDEHSDDIVLFFENLNKVMSGDMDIGTLLFGGWKNQTQSAIDPTKAAMDYLTGKNLSYDDFEKAVGGYDIAQAIINAYDQYDGELTEEVVAKWTTDAMANLQSDLDNANLTATVTMDVVMGKLGGLALSGLNWFGRLLFGDRPGDGQQAAYHADGLNYVPYNDYFTRLHRGESVLTRMEAENWRSAQRNGGMSADPAAIGSAVCAALAGVSITMDGRSVGTLVTPYVSKEQYKESWKRR